MIRKLPPHLVHQIAAGEVVERPASALKELIENALDANATRLKIEYEAGGLKFLSVEDDGKGIDAVDLPMAFEAHATSKLEKFEDFEKLKTLGFRGEALCSLGAVGDLEIYTTARGQSLGTIGRLSFGELQTSEAADRRVGTRVTVKDLFAKLPARLKFLKSERSEAQALNQVWRKYALAYPEIDIEVVDRGANKTTRIARSSLAERVQWFFESESSEQWIEIKAEANDTTVSGFMLRPRYFGKAKSGLQFFLNKRPIKDQKLEFAVRRGLEGFSLFPKDVAGVFLLEVNPKFFDVNVHPTKMEVRFTKPDAIFSLVVHAIRDAMSEEHKIEIDPRVSLAASMGISVDHFREVVREMEPVVQNAMQTHSQSRSLEFTSVGPDDAVSTSGFQPAFIGTPERYEFLGAIDETFLLARRGQDLWIFDQHALHERVVYEKLLRAYDEETSLPSQRLLFPVALKFEGAEQLLEKEEMLSRLGFEVRAWNDNQVRLVAAPAGVKRDHADILCKLVENSDRANESVMRDTLASIACHSAIRAHDKIDRVEAERLLRDFESEEALGHCPHGRPTFVRLQPRDFDKMFQRVV